MASSGKNNFTYKALLIGLAALLLFWLVDGYFGIRQQMTAERDARAQTLRDAQGMLQHQQRLHDLLTRLGPTVRADPSQLEGKFMHLINDWEQQTGVTNASFQRLTAVDDHGYTRLTFSVSASGNLAAVAGLLYRVETASIPLRIDDALVRSKGDAGNEVQVHLTISTPCRGVGNQVGQGVVAAVETGGQG